MLQMALQMQLICNYLLSFCLFEIESNAAQNWFKLYKIKTYLELLILQHPQVQESQVGTSIPTLTFL